ncbi:MAG: amidohydrolase [Phycisphaerales bacterium]|jgi:amidohydrolase|nr:amidohydrolase [Phycisphaerales bacterium]
MTITPNLSAKIDNCIKEILPQLIEIRHDLHAHPELGYQETRTSELIKRELTADGVSFVGGLAGGTGVLGHIKGSGTEAVGLRADIDALPITEVNTIDWKSLHEGCMHACGHDGHTTILIGAAKVLSSIAKKNELPHPVTFVFQPAEEGGAGGKRMVEDGCLDGSLIGSKVSVMYGLHGWPQARSNLVQTRVGPVLASDIGVNIKITGTGGHAAFPHFSHDPILCAANVISSMQQIVSRNTDPLDSLVITLTQIHGGTTHNIIPSRVDITGTIRFLQESTGEMAKCRVKEITESTANAHNCSAEVSLTHGYPVTRNDEHAVAQFFKIAKEVLPSGLVSEFPAPVMGGEDFSYYCNEVPSCFFMLGLLPEGKDKMPSLHQPDFDFNDSVIETGIKMFCELALRYNAS